MPSQSSQNSKILGRFFERLYMTSNEWWRTLPTSVQSAVAVPGHKTLLSKYFPGWHNAQESPCAFIPQGPDLAFNFLLSTHACVTCALCLFYLHWFIWDRFILLSTKLWQLSVSIWQHYQTMGVSPFLGRDIFHRNGTTAENSRRKKRKHN